MQVLLYKPLRLRLTIQQSDCWPFRSLSIRMPNVLKIQVGRSNVLYCIALFSIVLCFVNYVTRKERIYHRGSPRNEIGDKYHESQERRSVSLEGSI